MERSINIFFSLMLLCIAYLLLLVVDVYGTNSNPHEENMLVPTSSPPPSHHKSSSLIDCMDSPCAKAESVTTKTEFINNIGKIRPKLISEIERSNNISSQKQHKLTVESSQMLYLHQPRRGVRRYRQVREDKRVAKNNTFKSISNETKKVNFETNLSKSRRPTTNTRNITRQKIQRMIAESAATTLVASTTVTVLTFDNTSEIGFDEFYDEAVPTNIYFVKKPPNTDASEIGNTLTYDCEVDTSNLTVNPEIYWNIPGMSSREKKVTEDLYAGDFRKDIFVTSNHSLVIKNVRKEHKGIYKCVVTVGQHTKMVSVALSVNKKSKFELLIRLVVGFSAALVIIVVFGSLWIVLRILKNRKSRYIQCNLHESL